MRILRNSCTTLTLLFSFLLLIAFPATSASTPQKGKYIFFVGTYTEEGSKSKGIYAYSYDAETGQIAPLGLSAETTNPSWVTLSPNGRFLYAVNEVGNYKGPNSGGLSAFSIDRDKGGRATGKLTFLNEVATRGADPCYVTVDQTGKYVLVANYTGGSIAVFPIRDDGSLGEASDFVQHTGHGADPKRQEGPHAHSINLSPDNRYAFVDDLGLDALLSYQFDANSGKLTGLNTIVARFDAGSGPRHFALRPDGKFAYVISEMHSSVTVLAANLPTGSFQSLHWYSTVPPDFKGHNDAAEVAVHPSGKFLFASNRGHDSIVVFDIDPMKGTLKPHWMVSALISTPRSFEIDPTGALLFVANQQSNNIVVFKIDDNTGSPTPTGQVLDVASPVCVKFLKVE